MKKHESWFANRGQIIQIGLTAAGVALAARNAWPDLKNSEYLSGGALLLYFLVALILFAMVRLIIEVRQSQPSDRRPDDFDALRKDLALAEGEVQSLQVQLKLENTKTNEQVLARYEHENAARAEIQSLKAKAETLQSNWQTELERSGQLQKDLEKCEAETQRLASGFEGCENQLERYRQWRSEDVAKNAQLAGECADLKDKLDYCKRGRIEDAHRIGVLNGQFAAMKLSQMALGKGVSANLTVVIRFVHPDDAKLAEYIEQLFLQSATPSPWKTMLDRNMIWRKNPTIDKARIVVTAKDHALSSTIASTFNTHKLIQEDLAGAAPQEDEKANDVTITIYTEPKKPS